MSNGNMDALLELANKIGELAGSNQAVINELGRLNSELIRLGVELDNKHDENIREISRRHEENIRLLGDHKADDLKNFGRVFKWFNYVSGAIGVLVVLWTVLTFIIPYVMRAHLGE